MVYSSRNVSVLLNDTGVFATEASVSSTSAISPNYHIDKRIATEYYLTDGPNGTLSLSYFMTGKDPLLSCVDNEFINISGNFAGLYFNSGKLTNYSISANPNEALIAQAEIVFYEQLKGSFSPRKNEVPNAEVLSSNNVGIVYGGSTVDSSLYGGHSVLDFSYDCKIIAAPQYTVHDTGTDLAADKIIMGRKEVGFSFSTHELNIDVPPTGKKEKFEILIQDDAGVLKESLRINGMVSDESISAGGAGELIVKQVSVSQGHLGLDPTISSLSPTSGPITTLVTVNGTNLSNTRGVELSSVPIDFAVNSDSQIEFPIPVEPISGPVRIITEGGEVLSTQFFTVT